MRASFPLFPRLPLFLTHSLTHTYFLTLFPFLFGAHTLPPPHTHTYTHNFLNLSCPHRHRDDADARRRNRNTGAAHCRPQGPTRKGFCSAVLCVAAFVLCLFSFQSRGRVVAGGEAVVCVQTTTSLTACASVRCAHRCRRRSRRKRTALKQRSQPSRKRYAPVLRANHGQVHSQRLMAF